MAKATRSKTTRSAIVTKKKATMEAVASDESSDDIPLAAGRQSSKSGVRAQEAQSQNDAEESDGSQESSVDEIEVIDLTKELTQTHAIFKKRKLNDKEIQVIHTEIRKLKGRDAIKKASIDSEEVAAAKKEAAIAKEESRKLQRHLQELQKQLEELREKEKGKKSVEPEDDQSEPDEDSVEPEAEQSEPDENPVEPEEDTSEPPASVKKKKGVTTDATDKRDQQRKEAWLKVLGYFATFDRLFFDNVEGGVRQLLILADQQLFKAAPPDRDSTEASDETLLRLSKVLQAVYGPPQRNLRFANNVTLVDLYAIWAVMREERVATPDYDGKAHRLYERYVRQVGAEKSIVTKLLEAAMPRLSYLAVLMSGGYCFVGILLVHAMGITVQDLCDWNQEDITLMLWILSTSDDLATSEPSGWAKETRMDTTNTGAWQPFLIRLQIIVRCTIPEVGRILDGILLELHSFALHRHFYSLSNIKSRTKMHEPRQRADGVPEIFGVHIAYSGIVVENPKTIFVDRRYRRFYKEVENAGPDGVVTKMIAGRGKGITQLHIGSNKHLTEIPLTWRVQQRESGDRNAWAQCYARFAEMARPVRRAILDGTQSCLHSYYDPCNATQNDEQEAQLLRDADVESAPIWSRYMIFCILKSTSEALNASRSAMINDLSATDVYKEDLQRLEELVMDPVEYLSDLGLTGPAAQPSLRSQQVVHSLNQVLPSRALHAPQPSQYDEERESSLPVATQYGYRWAT